MTTAKRRRTKGDGSVYRAGRFWWFAYRGQDGKRKKESSRSERQSVALRMLRKKLGAVAHRLPDVKHAEYVTFYDAAQAVLADFTTNGKRSLPVPLPTCIPFWARRSR